MNRRRKGGHRGPRPLRPNVAKRSSPRKVRARSRTGREKPKGVRQVVMMTLIPVLAVALLVLVRRPLGTPGGAKAETLDTAPAASVTTGEVRIDWEIPPVYEATGHDPMRLGPPPQVQEEKPPAAPVQAREDLDVKGVLYSEDRPAAIIGTRLVHEGEQIAGVTVVAIERDGVEFERNGKKWRQTVSASPVSPSQETGQSPEDGS